jgi:hypothetical protein
MLPCPPTKAKKKNLKKYTKNLLLFARCYILISYELCPMSTCEGQYVGNYSLMYESKVLLGMAP